MKNINIEQYFHYCDGVLFSNPARSFFSKEGATSLKSIFLMFLSFLWAFFRNSNSWFLTTAISGPPSSGYKTCVTESPAILKLG